MIIFPAQILHFKFLKIFLILHHDLLLIYYLKNKMIIFWSEYNFISPLVINILNYLSKAFRKFIFNELD